MPGKSIVAYLNPWMRKREREAERVRLLRERDGDSCARCRRPLRFDLPRGHDQGATVEAIAAGAGIEAQRLCHGRCFAPGLDHTGEVTERMRRKNEAALLSKTRTRKPRKAA